MASTFSSLKIELIATGEQSGTWGSTTNTNLGTALEEAITGSASIPFSSANVELTLTDTNATQAARNLRLNLTGTSGGARNLFVPAIEKQYIVKNGLADTVTITNGTIAGGATGTGVAVAAGTSVVVFNDGTNIERTSTAAGTVTDVTVATANGLAGTSSGGTTPALTLSTTVTGLLKGNGTAISAASSGTDYAPATSGTSILYGNGSGGFSNVTVGTGVDFTAGVLTTTGVFTGTVTVSGTSASAADIRLGEDTDNGTNYIALKAPATVASNLTFVLPAVDGLDGQALITNGSGTLSFGSAGISTGKAIAMAMIFGG